MISHDDAQKACETYINSLVASDIDAVLGLFADDATIEDPVGTGLKTGTDVLREFYSGAAGAITSGCLTGPVRVAGTEVAFSFELTIGTGEKAMKMDIIDVFKFNDAGKGATMRAFWGKENMRPAGA